MDKITDRAASLFALVALAGVTGQIIGAVIFFAERALK